MVFAPSTVFTITVEARPDGAAETHLHAGGQGVWVARLLARLGIEVLDSDAAVLAGPDGENVLPPDAYRRLASDLATGGVPVIADLSGAYLDAAAAGRVTVPKASHEDLIDDGRAQSGSPADLMRTMQRLAQAGAAAVIVSR